MAQKTAEGEPAPDSRFARFDHAFNVVMAAATVLVFFDILVIEPLRGRLPVTTALGIVGAVAAMLLLALGPKLFRGKEISLAIAAGAVAFVAAPRHIGQLSFYSTVAQIVPVLFVALAFESRSFWIRERMDETTRRMAILVAVALVYSGGECLHVLAAGRPRSGDAQLVVAALSAAITALGLSAINGPIRLAASRESPTAPALEPPRLSRQPEPAAPTGEAPPGRDALAIAVATAIAAAVWMFIRARRPPAGS